ncbi:MAG: hypothetical protein ABIG71_04940, partial [Candidatus Uhrbacteria bacterium]
VLLDVCDSVTAADEAIIEHQAQRDRDCEFEASAQADFRAFVRSRFSCLGVKQQQAFAGMLRVAAVDGDTTAQIAIDAITRTACTTLHELGGVSDADRDGAIDSCVVAMPRADGTFGDSEREPSVQARTMRFAQLLPLVAAGTASPMATEHFCADYTVLPFDAQLVLTRGQPKLPELLQRYCSK